MLCLSQIDKYTSHGFRARASEKGSNARPVRALERGEPWTSGSKRKASETLASTVF